MPDLGDDEGHLSEEGLVRLLADELDSATAVELARHLIRGCKQCCSLLAPIVVGPRKSSSGGPREEDRYELPVARALATARAVAEALERNRMLTRIELAQILDSEGDREPLFIRTGEEISPSWRWAWCEVLIEAAVDRRASDLQDAAELAEIAVLLAEDLTGGPYPPRALIDLQARAWMERGNILRARGDLDGAEAALARSRELLLKGTESVLLCARLLDFEGSLYRDQRQFDEAMEVLKAAGQVYQQSGERHLAGRVLVKMGVTLLHASEPEKALIALEQAFDLLDFEREPAMLVALVHNRLLALVDAGRPEEAARALWRFRAVYDELGSELDRIKLLGLEGRIATDLGQPNRAERLFREEKAGFEREDLAYDAALVALDLSGVLLDQGKPGEVLELVDEMLETFRKLQIGREAAATVLILRNALVQGEATASLAREVAVRLRNLNLQAAAR